MPEETIKQILMRRDKLSSDAADDVINSALEELEELEEVEGGGKNLWYAEGIIADHFGLEPDFLEEFLSLYEQRQ